MYLRMMGGPTWLATHVVLTPQALPSPTTASRCSSPKCSEAAKVAKKREVRSRGRRHWVGDFTFIPFSNTASLTLSLTLGPGWTDRRGRAAIDLPVIMGVTQEATWPPSSLLAALQACISQRITFAPQQRLVLR